MYFRLILHSAIADHTVHACVLARKGLKQVEVLSDTLYVSNELRVGLIELGRVALRAARHDVLRGVPSVAIDSVHTVVRD